MRHERVAPENRRTLERAWAPRAPLALVASRSYLFAMPDARHIVCPHCDAVNRVAAGKPAAEAKCGVCHKPLFSGHPLPVAAGRFDKHITRNDLPVVVDFWAA